MATKTLDVRISKEARRALFQTQRKLGLGQVGDVLRTLAFLGLLDAPAWERGQPRKLDDRFRAKVSDEMAAQLRSLASEGSTSVERLLDAILIEADRRLGESTTCRPISRTARTTRAMSGRETTSAGSWGPLSPNTSGAS